MAGPLDRQMSVANIPLIGGPASYLARHWRGELSLPVAYWINGFLGNLALRLTGLAIDSFSPSDEDFDPAFVLLAATAYWAIAFAILVWQAVGIWRSARRHSARGGSRVWAVLAQAAVVIGSLVFAGSFARTGWPQLEEFVNIARGDPDIGPHQVRVLRGGSELEFSGGITFGVAGEVEAVLDATPQATVLHLNSPGGRVAEARKLFQLIRKRNLVTYSAAGCFSACTVAFLGGRERWISRAAKLGFHQLSFPGLSAGDAAVENERMRQFYLAQGIGDEFAARAINTPPESMWYPTPDELMASGFISGVADSSRFAISGFDNGQASVEAVDAELLEIGVYRVIRQAEPSVYQQIRDQWVQGLSAGATEAELMAATWLLVQQIYFKYLPQSPDTELIESINVAIEEITAVNRQNPDVCYKWVALGQTVGNLGAYLPPDLQRRELAAEERMIEAAIKSPQIPPSEAEVADTLTRLIAILRVKYGADADVLGNLEDPDVDHRTACKMIAAMYQEAVALPPEQSGPLLRYILSRE